jgi:hypothetical protein
LQRKISRPPRLIYQAMSISVCLRCLMIFNWSVCYINSVSRHL